MPEWQQCNGGGGIGCVRCDFVLFGIVRSILHRSLSPEMPRRVPIIPKHTLEVHFLEEAIFPPYGASFSLWCIFLLTVPLFPCGAFFSLSCLFFLLVPSFLFVAEHITEHVDSCHGLLESTFRLIFWQKFACK